jgi:hemerythrin
MLDALAVIRKVVEEHHGIRGNMKLAGESVNDLEAIFSLQKAEASWSLASTDMLSEKQNKMQQTLSLLEEGLKNHFAFEEKTLPPLLGELLMRALILDHTEIAREIGKVKSIAVDTQLDEFSREELLSQKSRIWQAIDRLYQTVEEHATREEVILKMVKKAVETPLV